jgi:hypothetical protein
VVFRFLSITASTNLKNMGHFVYVLC